LPKPSNRLLSKLSKYTTSNKPQPPLKPPLLLLPPLLQQRLDLPTRNNSKMI